MVIAAITDIHGKIEAVDRASKVLTNVDIVVITGDITHFGRRKDAEGVIRRAMDFNSNVYAVPGNCDYSEVGAFLSSEGILLDCRCMVIDDVAFIGIGGSLPCPGKTPNESSEEEFAIKLNELKKEIPSDKRCLLVSHEPPFGTRCDLTGSGTHVGSRAIRNFIMDVNPLLCFSGHIHEARGVGTIGMTKVANPGPLFHGGYTLADINNDKVKVDIFEL
jgi:Icc-related predicted phosphoesterase